jgi:hypothetical protein
MLFFWAFMVNLQSNRRTTIMTPSSTIPEPSEHSQCPRVLSPRQLDANRRNAQHSTGPRTEEGKAAARLNARRHDLTGQVNILPDAERTAIEAFCQPIIESFAPASAYELQLARGIAEAQWRLNRARAVEDNYFALQIADFADHSLAGDNHQIADALHQARAFFDRSADFGRFTLYEQRIQRAMAKNLQLLKDAKQERLAAEAKAREAEAKVFEEAQLLRQLAIAKGEDFNPEGEAKANNGFVYSIEQLDAAIARQSRLREAREALMPAKTRPDPARYSLAELLRQAA